MRAALVRWTTPKNVIGVATILVIAYLAVLPVATLLVASFRSNFLESAGGGWTIQNYLDTLSSDSFPGILWNSLVFAGLTSVIATTLGMAIAWLYVRTNAPGKALALLVGLVPLVVPGVMNAAAWVLLLAPGTGPVNKALTAVGLPEIKVYTMTAMVLVQSFHMVSLSFLMGMSMMASMDRSLEEAAAMSGARPRRVVSSVVLPIMRSGVFGVALLIFVLTISSFEVPQLFGVPGQTWVLTTTIYNSTEEFPVDYGTISVLGVIVLVIALLGVAISGRLGRAGGAKGRETVTGKGFRPTVMDLGRWRWLGLAFIAFFGLVGVALPVVVIVWSSFLPGYRNPSAQALREFTLANYRTIFETPGLLGALRNTVYISLMTGLITCLLCLIIAYLIVKARIRGRRLLEMLATAPIALPGVILGVALLYWYLSAPLPFDLYGTRTLLIIAFVTSAIPFGLRFMEPGLAQLGTELEEAASSSGANGFQIAWRIYVPLLRPTLMATFIICFILGFKELTSALFLYSKGSEVVAVSMYSLWLTGAYTAACAMGTLLLLVLVMSVVVIRLVSGRSGIGPRSTSGLASKVGGIHG